MSSSTLRTKLESNVDDKGRYPTPDPRLDSDDEELPKYEVRGPLTLFGRFLNLIPGTSARRRSGNIGDYRYHYHMAPTDEAFGGSVQISATHRGRRSQPRKWLRLLKLAIIYLPTVILCLFGALHVLLVLFGKKKLFWNVDEYGPHLSDWTRIGSLERSRFADPMDAIRNVSPVPCHSHNDYWRRIPLFEAIYWGCTSVEVDVWHFKDEDELFVGHNTVSLGRERTFTNVYVDPLVQLLDTINSKDQFSHESGSNGVFRLDPSQTLVLLIDFKTDGHDLFPYVWKHLEPLRKKNYLSYWDGQNFISRPITVVGSGNAPFDLIIQQTDDSRDIFFDAPLEELWEAPQTHLETHHQKRAPIPGQGKTGIDIVRSPDDFNISNSYFASIPLSASIGFPWKGRLTETQLHMIRGQIRGAKRRGLKARYWDTPSWPTSLRNYIWQVLVNEGVDILNVDDLKSAVALDWSVSVQHSWFDA